MRAGLLRAFAPLVYCHPREPGSVCVVSLKLSGVQNPVLTEAPVGHRAVMVELGLAV